MFNINDGLTFLSVLNTLLKSGSPPSNTSHFSEGKRFADKHLPSAPTHIREKSKQSLSGLKTIFRLQRKGKRVKTDIFKTYFDWRRQAIFPHLLQMTSATALCTQWSCALRSVRRDLTNDGEGKCNQTNIHFKPWHVFRRLKTRTLILSPMLILYLLPMNMHKHLLYRRQLPTKHTMNCLP